MTEQNFCYCVSITLSHDLHHQILLTNAHFSPVCFMCKTAGGKTKTNMIKGYFLPWAKPPSPELFKPGEWAYPETMIEQVKEITQQGITFLFPLPMTRSQVLNYSPEILNEELGYKLIFTGGETKITL